MDARIQVKGLQRVQKEKLTFWIREEGIKEID
jgi:hypothetical protein